MPEYIERNKEVHTINSGLLFMEGLIFWYIGVLLERLYVGVEMGRK